ncbi:tetratricopeptide repeat protein [Candidatus Uabimicrobium amorphum]|uniref:Uncharacterized protein n=1 Tax=Uabimicrobium amorphum TaxID=2596890 RepID=A0A5S9INL6_UABAM|nr:hypothetical protein [Candidatus Uabimicrobium amorphum]BBM85218.1 hypothetical protein UABAM_03581 [Candidatus Uabimicrobium amorphum]
MNELIKFYYRAVSYYYVGNNYAFAQEECYKAIDFSTHNKVATALLKVLKPRAHTRFNSFHCHKLLEQLDNADIDNFLVLFLAQYHAESIVFRQINWGPLQENFTPNAVKHRMWAHIFEGDWRYALQSAESLLLPIQGDPVVYFQLATIYFHMRHFSEAEKYLFVLGQYGGIYTTAAISLLLQLPQRTFDTLAKNVLLTKYSQTLSMSEKLVIADFLQKSWDQKALFAYGKSLLKQAQDRKDYLGLAEVYLEAGYWNQAIDCCYALRKPTGEDIEEITRIFLHHPSQAITKSHKAYKFFKWLIVTSKDSSAVFFMNRSLRSVLPKLAMKGYKKFRSENEKESLLGQSICYFYLCKYSRCKKLLCHVEEKYPDLSAQVTEWRARIDVQVKPQQTLLELWGKSDKLDVERVLRDLCSSVCPVCHTYQKELSFCHKCGFIPLNIFAWENDHLRWQSNKLLFPRELLLVTTSAIIYEKNTTVVFVVFSPRSVTFELKKNGKQYDTNTIDVNGLEILKKTLNETGMYEAIVRTKYTESTCKFFVADGNDELSVSCVTQRWVAERELEIVLRVADGWGYGVSGTPQVDLYDLHTQNHRKCNIIEQKGNRLYCYWKNLEVLTPYKYVFLKMGEQSWVITVKTQKTASWQQIVERFYSPLEKVGYQYQVTKKKLCIDTKYSCQEMSVVTQPIGADAVDIFRENNTQYLEVSIPKFVGGAYFGAARFAKKKAQERGVEVAFPLICPPPKFRVSFPEEVQPNLKFSVDVSSDFSGKLYILSRDKNVLFYSLKDQLAMRDNTLHCQHSQSTMWNVLPSDLNINSRYYTYIGDYDFSQSGQIELKAMPQEGTQKFTFLASDGNFFIEKTIAIRVIHSMKIECSFPEKIGEKDHCDIPITFCSQLSVPFSVHSQNKGVIVEGQAGNETVSIKVHEPDVFTLNLGDKKQVHKVDPLLEREETHSVIEKVTPENISADVRVYRNGYGLIREIATNIKDDPFCGLDHVAAKLYALGVLYKLTAEGKIDSDQYQNEQAILQWQKHLPDIENLNFREPQLVTVILLYLSLYIEIPKFKDIKKCATDLQNKCLENNIKDNRLLFLSLDFSKKTRNALDAAGAILHDIKVKKATRYLQKTMKDSSWTSKLLGGNITATVWATHALCRIDHHLAQQAFDYVNTQWGNNSLGNVHADIAYMKLMYAVTQKNEQLSWQRKDTSLLSFVLQGLKPQQLKLRLVGPEVLKPGHEFTLKGRIKSKYPKILLYIPGNIIVYNPQYQDRKHSYSGNVVWPISTNELQLKCKALCSGVGTVYVVVEDMYKYGQKIYDSYQLVVV